MKKCLSLALCLVLAFAALWLPGCASGPATFTILYTADVHGRIAATDEAIGLDTVAAIKADTPDSILVDVGDFLHGSPTATLSEGEDVVRLMRQAGYQMAVVGNHEFSYGAEVLAQRQQQAEAGEDPMPFLSANVLDADGTPRFTPWLTVKVAGLKVGLFGLTTPDTAFQAAPDAVAGLTFEDPAVAAARAVEQLQKEKCDVIVALTHVGTDAASAAQSTAVAAVPGVNAVIDAHSHRVQDTVVNGVPLVEAGEYGQLVGKLTLTWDRASKQLTAMQNAFIDRAAAARIQPRPALQTEIREMQLAQWELLSATVGHTPVDLIADKETVRTAETNLGNLTADVLMQATGADFGLMNAGCIRETIPAGDITMEQVLASFPYSNLVVTKQVTGAQLYEIMEHAVGLLPEADGRFAQISGFAAEIDPAKAPGSRVTALTLPSGARIPRDDTAYILATNDYVAAGGDDYPVLGDLPLRTQGETVEEAFLQALEAVDFAAYAAGPATRLVFAP